MSTGNRKLEEIVGNLKSEGGKKLKSGQTTTRKNSNMAANNENSATGSSTGSDSGDNGETSLRTLRTYGWSLYIHS